MKYLFFFMIISSLLFSSCGGIKTSSQGLENASYLEFIATPGDYSGGVDVTVDGTTTFNALVHKDLARKIKGEVYSVSTGTHTIAVSYKGKLLVQKQIFVSAQETKKIVLP